MIEEELSSLGNLKGQLESITNLPTNIISAPFAGLVVSQIKNLLGIEDLIRGLIRDLLQDLDICELINSFPIKEVEAKIKYLYGLRNDIIDFINQIIQIITAVLAITSIIQIIITVFKVILEVIPIVALAIPSAVPPGIGLPVGLGVMFSTLLSKAKDFISSVESVINVINSSLKFLAEQLMKIIDVLSSISLELFECTNKLNEVELNQDNEVIKLKETIKNNPTQNDINQLNRITQDNFNRIVGELSPIPNINLGIQPDVYKGFTFDIKIKKTIEGTPLKYAVALDSRKIEVLEGKPSFASDTTLLIQELKTVIDSQNLTGF